MFVPFLFYGILYNNGFSGFNRTKLSQERSVWIYKHAFFRRDEPQLLHALKRKTNQQGGGRLFGGAMMLDSEPDDITLERIRQARYVIFPGDKFLAIYLQQTANIAIKKTGSRSD